MIARSPRLLLAWWDTDGTTFFVYRSLVVRDGDEILKPVDREIESHGLVEVSRKEVADPEMRFGSAYLVEFQKEER